MTAPAARLCATVGAALALSALLLVMIISRFASDEHRFGRSVDLGSSLAGALRGRRLLLQQDGGGGGAATERMGEGCSKDDIAVYQAQTAPLPSGIPTYTVNVLNLCSGGGAMSRIHVSCGWFASARLVNPRLFRRLRFDDCLVNDGRPLRSGASLSFQYANTFKYNLAVVSANATA